MSESAAPEPTPGAKMLYLIRRRPAVTHEELVAHWFAYHMPNVVRAQGQQASAGKRHARRYQASLFLADRHGAHPWDGMAQLWFDAALPTPDAPHGSVPVDSFQERAEPYLPWATQEYVIVDGSDRLAVEPSGLSPAFPATRSGFHKVTILLAARPDGGDVAALHRHWLTVHAPEVAALLKSVGGFHYVVNLTTVPTEQTFAGVAELYFPDEASWAEFQASLRPDGMEALVDPEATVVLRSATELVGIP